MLKRLKKLM